MNSWWGRGSLWEYVPLASCQGQRMICFLFRGFYVARDESRKSPPNPTKLTIDDDPKSPGSPHRGC
jgi:hypothetical protein